MTHPLLAAQEHEKQNCRKGLLKALKGQVSQAVKGCPVTQKLTMWIALQGGAGDYSFQEITQFIKDNPDWPNQSVLKRSAEGAILSSTPAADLVAWFKEYPPLTSDGVLAYGSALKQRGQSQVLKAYVKNAWVEKDFSKLQQKEFLKNFGDLLTQGDHHNRLERLLWDHQTDQAERMMSLVKDDQKRLAEARLAFKAGKKSGVPAKHKTHEGALYDQVHSLRKQGRFDEAAHLIHKAKHSPKYAHQWWRECNYIAREFMEDGRFEDALQLITTHKLTSGENFATAEWTAGWVCLQFLKAPAKAVEHFKTLFHNVKSPISLSRAAYWIGRSYEALNQKQEAANWYQRAAQVRTTYYGQLAAAKLELKPYPELKHHKGGTVSAKVLKHELVQSLQLLASLGKKAYHWTRPFTLKLAKQAQSEEEKHTLLSFIAQLVPHDAVWFARTAGSDKHLEFTQGYPRLQHLPQGEELPEMALSHAIAYQESRFDQHAISSAGAMGLMQLMPGTARDTAKKIGENHKASQLIADPKHNVRLGSHHLGHMLERFDNNYILAIVAYNAGHAPVERWIKLFGDPRKGEVDIIDWIELIPYYETRNYVQRVLENLGPYRSLLNGEVKETLVDDLQR